MPDEMYRPQPCADCVLLVRELEKRIIERMNREESYRKELANLTNKRLDDHNNDRDDFVRIPAYEVRHRAIEEALRRLEKWQYWVMGLGVGVGYLIAHLAGLVKL